MVCCAAYILHDCVHICSTLILPYSYMYIAHSGHWLDLQQHCLQGLADPGNLLSLLQTAREERGGEGRE